MNKDAPASSNCQADDFLSSAKHMARRKELFEMKGGASCATPGGVQHIGFAADAEKHVGADKSTINRAVRRGEKIADDVLDIVNAPSRPRGAL